MVSASGLLETSHRLPNLDYNILMKLTLELTRNYQDIEQLFRLMCFNVFAHNRDDHSKNFSYLYDYNKKEFIKKIFVRPPTFQAHTNTNLKAGLILKDVLKS